MRSISAEVIVSGGMSTTTSPSGRSSTPRRTAAGAHPAAPAQAVGGRRELDAAHQARAGAPRARRRAARPALVEERARAASERAAHVGEHVPLVDQLEVAQRHRGGERVPAVGVPVVERALAEVGAEERVEHAAAGDGGRHRRGSRR